MSAELAQKRREFFQSDPSNSKKFSLIDLPTEVLERIFYFLPAKVICRDVDKTCKRLHKITKTPAFWSNYLRVCKEYEPISSRIIDLKPWERAFAFEHEEERWQQKQSLMRYRLAQVHAATVDALKVHETKNGARIAISGARDRAIVLWDLKNVASNETDKSSWHKTIPSAHTGWVWTVCISNNDKSVFSCGFDSMLKQWEIVDGTLRLVREHNNHNEALLKCIVEDDYLYTTTYTGKIYMADTRIGLDPQKTLQIPGRNAVNCMESSPTSDYLYAISTQSGSLYCVDKRQMKLVKRSPNFFKHCMSIDFDADFLVASWKNGMVRYLNPLTLKTEYTWNCPTPSEMKSVNPLRLSKGAFIYGNSYELLIYTPGRHPRLLGKLPTKEMVISLDYNNGDLVCGMSEGVVVFWPRENHTFSIIKDSI